MDSSINMLSVSVSELQKDEGDEVWYQNNLYDVVQRKNLNGAEYVYLMKDDKEQEEIESSNNYFEKDLGITFLHGYSVRGINKTFSITDKNYISSYLNKKGAMEFISAIFLHSSILKVNHNYLSVPTPPPRLASAIL